MNIPEIKIIEYLSYGNLGRNSDVFKGINMKTNEVFAIKTALNSKEVVRHIFKEELEKSKELSRILPNTIAYHSDVKLINEGYEHRPAFSMDVFKGVPIMDININIYRGRLGNLLTEKALVQLETNLKEATKHGWDANDLQYAILIENQILNKKQYSKGDLIFFDFGGWKKTNTEMKISEYVNNLEKILI